MWAAAHRRAIHEPAPAADRAAAAARRRFEAVVARALATDPRGAATFTADAAGALVASYAEAIGEVEQAPAGEDRALDALLRR